jgi:hypothetical protein
MNDDAIAAACEIAAVFEGLDVAYMIGGSLASTLWAEPRFTLDVDFVAALEGPHVSPLLGALGDAWYADEWAIREAVVRRASFNLIRLQRMVKVDVFVPPEGGLHASKWGRVRHERIDPTSSRRVAVTSPEDILLQKLDWYRDGGCVSENQWRDVTGLLRIQGSRLDGEYLSTWAERMDLTELLARARAEACP